MPYLQYFFVLWVKLWRPQHSKILASNLNVTTIMFRKPNMVLANLNSSTESFDSRLILCSCLGFLQAFLWARVWIAWVWEYLERKWQASLVSWPLFPCIDRSKTGSSQKCGSSLLVSSGSLFYLVPNQQDLRGLHLNLCKTGHLITFRLKAQCS